MAEANETPAVTPGSEEYNTQMTNLADANVNQEPEGQNLEAPTVATKPDHVPDKFWDTENGVVNFEAWSKSTNELETKFTEQNQDIDTNNEDANSDNKVPDGAPISQESFDNYTKEFNETGELSKDSYAELAKAGIPADYVDAYVAGQKSLAESSEAGVLKAGGFEDRAAFDKASDWAVTNLPASDIEAFNETMNGGDTVAMGEAMKNLNDAYGTAKGSTTSNLLDGNGNTSLSSSFASQAEVTAAMSDPRYKVDPAYRATVMQKLSSSNF